MPGLIPTLSAEERFALGLRAAGGHMYQQDKIWSRHSNDKVDIASALARILRTLGKSLPLDQPLTALSVGSSNEPQFRILESAFRGGLFLVDIEDAALAVVEERTQRQNTPHVKTIRGDYPEVFRDEEAVLRFRAEHLSDRRMTLITLHHSLYYSPQSFWHGLLANLYRHVLAVEPGPGPCGAIHAVLMASRSDDPTSTTWLYNHFAGRFFNHHNDQDLLACATELATDPLFAGAQILTKSSRVEFFVDDFERFMAVVWMILLHPNVHQFSEDQQREVVEWVYANLWSRAQPLVQIQDHAVIYRGTGIAGII
ncbi:MAG: class I SAM-dependent methyltransferase [Planctomycetia bacterium]|nr:class I SAM-dependent methyltransferase [Planctomycetia bacterium]